MLYRNKEAPEAVEADPKKNSKKEDKKKDEKKEVKKDNKGKKKNMSSVLDNYTLITSDEKVIASFELELSNLLDGVTREVKKSFSKDIVIKNVTTTSADEKKKVKSATTDKKKNKSPSMDKGATPNKKKETTAVLAQEKDNDKESEQPPPPPLEFELSFEILDFNNYNQLRNHKK